MIDLLTKLRAEADAIMNIDFQSQGILDAGMSLTNKINNKIILTRKEKSNREPAE